MKYSIEDLKQGIAELAGNMGRITVMEVCGTHTASIRKYGIRELLPGNIGLISGPGCPVCVTDQTDISAALYLAAQKDVLFTCFGDMMRVPCGEKSLYSLYESGKDIRIVTSPMDALAIARKNPQKQTIYFGVGFETTAPLTAALIEAADESGIRNLSVLNVHKTMPQAITALLKNGSNVDALICPGHVASITGAKAFAFISEELMLPGAIAGFEVYDIMAVLFRIVCMLKNGERTCVNMYPRAVTENGNNEALSLLYKIFETGDAVWRGLGNISRSGLTIKKAYRGFDAAYRFDIPLTDTEEAKGCICARILCGKSVPTDCVNFGGACTPEKPLGACMVSSEGSCAAFYRYEGGCDLCREE